MFRKLLFPSLLVLALALSACNLNVPAAPTVLPPATLPAVTVVALPTATLLPPATLAPSLIPLDTAVPTWTPAPIVAVSVPASANFIDDRSSPWQVIVSYYNAISRQQYSRAYGYWNDPATEAGDFTAFSNGYADTASVDLVFGNTAADPGMSQVYYTVPVILKVTKTNSTHANYSACYVIHETNPGVYGAPPVDPMSMVQGAATVSDVNAPDASVLATACNAFPNGGMTANYYVDSPSDISANNFVDNLSGPVEVVSSLLNALNLKQYARGYGYFLTPASFPGTYDPWAAGYANTGSMTVTFGAPTSEGAAGSIYTKVPLATKVLTTANATQTFVGCYTLRQVQPGIQTAPPFQPIGIVSGKFNQVSNSADVNALLPTACN